MKILMICLATCAFRQKFTNIIVLIDHKNKSHRLNCNTLQGNVYVVLQGPGASQCNCTL